ncbi:M24 family metallopeptidase [Candidatus Peribacteria bacterium]|nr:M24 family metallopeptidase [Candidatus Peribacteria bacterium]
MLSLRRPRASQLLRRTSRRPLLISTLENIAYLTGLQVSTGFLLAQGKGYSLFLDSRYLESARSDVQGTLTFRPLHELPHTLSKIRSLCIEAENVTVARLHRWKKKYKNTKFVQTYGIVEEFRRTKEVDELRSIAKACVITKAILRRMPTLIILGITERELAWTIECECRKLGAEGMAFSSIVAFGCNTSRPHHHPTDRILRKHDLVQIDMGAKFGGYCSDYSRVYFTGKKTPDQTRALHALKKASAAAILLLRPGVTNRALDLGARKILKSYGYDKEFSHALGHGVGIDIHEGVTLSSRAPLSKIKKNEVITIEPGLYFEGQWGMRIEETIVVQ